MIRSPRWVRFCAVGAMGMCVQLAAVALLVESGVVPVAIATLAGVALAVLHNFAWHRAWTWRDRHSSGRGLLTAFLRFAGGNGLVSGAGTVVAAQLLAPRTGAGAVMASAVAIAACGLANWWIADRAVFRRPSPVMTPSLPFQVSCRILGPPLLSRLLSRFRRSSA